MLYRYWLGSIAVLLFYSLPLIASAQIDVIDSLYVTQTLPDSANYLHLNYEYYRARIPAGYSELMPPPLLIGCHQGGADYNDFYAQPLADTATAWGWMCLGICGTPPRTDGAGYTHWFSQRVLRILDHVLDTLAQRYPFNPDSIFIVGGSAGGAAGLQYHYTHLDPNGYMIAGAASGSGILDLLRRVREQIAYDGYRINASMHIEFGAADTTSGPENVNWRYKFNSAYVGWDTTNSRHYNLSWLPVYFAAGELEHHDTVAMDLISAYGNFMRAETLYKAPGNNHGFPNLTADTTMHWLRQWGKTYRHPTFQNVSCDSCRRCYDIEFVHQRVDTCVCRAYAYFDSAIDGNTWYLTHPRLTLMRNASRIRLYRYIPNTMQHDTLTIANRDTAEDTLYIRYPVNSLPGAWVFTLVPPIPGSSWVAANHELFLPGIPINSTIAIGASYLVDEAALRNALPEGYSMSVFPNPFNGMATIRFVMPRGTATDLTLYDVTGRMVKAFPRKFARSQSAVYFSLPSEGLASGSYFLLGKSGNTTLRQRVTILK